MGLIHWEDEELTVAGCDEAGRGCLAGVVTAAAVILPKDYHNSMLNDSKQLSEKKRDILRIDIEKNAIAWQVTHIPPRQIERINILNASILGMQKSVGALPVKPDLILVDGNRFKPYRGIPYRCIIKGDGKYYPIAAASILAKTHRDELMYSLAEKYPEYHWEKNKGYPTADHRGAIARFGTCELHRMTFRLLPEELTLFTD